MHLFPREMFQLVFIFLIFGSQGLKALNAVAEALTYSCGLQLIHSSSSVMSLNVQTRFQVWSMRIEQDLLM